MTPVFARDVFHLGASGLALLMGMAGAGALFGALFLAYLGDFPRKGWFVLGGDFAFAVCLICFSLSTNIVVSLVFLFLLGFGIVCSVAVSNMLLQKLVSNEMRGRVMSMFMLSLVWSPAYAGSGRSNHRSVRVGRDPSQSQIARALIWVQSSTFRLLISDKLKLEL